MGAVFSDSLIASAWESIQNAFRLARQGSALMEQGRFEDAARAFDGALELMPRLDRARFALAECYLRMGRPDLSAATCRKMIELDQQNVRAYLNLAAIYRHQNLLLRAVDVLEEGLAMVPEDMNLLYGLAVAHVELGDTARAIDYYRRIIKLDPSRADIKEELERLSAIKTRR
ncbi:MAG: tetratricopeptide repeat protein [bacterium]